MLVSRPPSAAGPAPKQGLRKVAGLELPTADKYEVTLGLSHQVLDLTVPRSVNGSEFRYGTQMSAPARKGTIFAGIDGCHSW